MKSLSNCLLTATTVMALTSPAFAQSYCASDGQPKPTQLLERFINADCESCWSDPATPKASAGQAVLDWIVPGAKGDDAPLSAVAAREGLDRLDALGQKLPAASVANTRNARGMEGTTLRVSHGLPLSGYLGASIELKPVPAAIKGQQWTAWLALVETVPTGTEGSPVERNLVRNVFQANWDGRKQLSNQEQERFFEPRSMSIAQGANPDRMRVIGWVEDEKGQLLTAAQSKCEEPPQPAN